jgi:hypothetical protein
MNVDYNFTLPIDSLFILKYFEDEKVLQNPVVAGYRSGNRHCCAYWLHSAWLEKNI